MMKKIYTALALWIFTSIAYAQKIETIPLRQQVLHEAVDYTQRIPFDFGVVLVLSAVTALIAYMIGNALNKILAMEDDAI